MEPIILETAPDTEPFDEVGYLRSHPDVAAAVRAGQFPSGQAHYRAHGCQENRRVLRPLDPAVKRPKIDRLRPLLRPGLSCADLGHQIRFFDPGAEPESFPASSHGYDAEALALIEAYADGWVLDCGAGRRPVYYPHVATVEIMPYDTTDVVADAANLPFRDGVFDAVLCLSVLEHVRDPFQCAREILRVLKPGGRLCVAVPFLQPLHGYPHHYMNFTHEGLRQLFAEGARVDSLTVPASLHPIWTLCWILQLWDGGLPVAAREEFRQLRVGDLLGPGGHFLDRPFVRELDPAIRQAAASGHVLLATKKTETGPGRAT